MGRAAIKLSQWLPLLLLVLSLALLASCGAGAGLDSAAADSSALANTDSSNSTAATDSSGITGSTELPSIPLDLPGDSRSSSAAGDPGGSIEVLGKDFVLQHNGVVDGDSLVLDPASGEEGHRRLAFGFYQANAGAGNRPLSLNVLALPGGINQNYWVAVADYTSLQWKFFGPINIPEFNLDLRGNNHRFVSQLGNVYFLVLAHEGNKVTHQKTILLTGSGSGDLPGAPFRMEASDGLFEHRVELGWQAGSDCMHFEIYRRDVPPPAGDNQPPAGDPGAPPPGDGNPPPGDPNNGGDGSGQAPPPPPQWRMIAVVDGNHFTDFLVIPGRPYEYRVRAMSPNGPSGFSNIDLGFALRGIYNGVIEGQVNVDGAPRPGVAVSLLGLGPDPVWTMTGPEGRYRFDNLPPLLYVVSALNPDLEFQPPMAVKKLEVGGETALINFEGSAATHFGHAWGLVYTWDPIRDDGTGGVRPLKDIHVGLWQAGAAPGSPELQGTSTGEGGLYQFFGLQPGDYTSKAGAEGMMFMPDIQRFRVDGLHVLPRLDFFGMPGTPPPPPADGGNGGSGTPPAA